MLCFSCYWKINDIYHDNALSFKSKSLLVYALCLPEGMNFSISEARKILNIGKHQVYAILKELISSGHCRPVYEKIGGLDVLKKYEFLGRDFE